MYKSFPLSLCIWGIEMEELHFECNRLHQYKSKKKKTLLHYNCISMRLLTSNGKRNFWFLSYGVNKSEYPSI